MPFLPIVQLTTDQIGDLGELLAAIALSRPVLGRYKRPLFKPTHLGGKYPAADFLVDVLTSDHHFAGFFFVQVKSTRKAGGPRRSRLPVTVGREKLNPLARLPAPAYLIGVDLTTERSYIVSASPPWRSGGDSHYNAPPTVRGDNGAATLPGSN